MTLRDGKFYDEHGQVVPLEIGNIEQYKLLQAHKSMTDGFCALEMVRCLCGGEVYRKVLPNGELECKTHQVHCVICGNRFEFYADGDYGVPACKLIPAKK
jgi:hypothetical protein